ncbi:MAG TPA: CBS domain-containing protein [Candidatus Deferrimicrobiaceae bacterium]|nr:CBS domain-containing protein [Candidatus Deferrimicrobiaceae bacterium]
MTKKVITITPEDTVRDANRILQENRIHHLPVVVGGELVGMVSDTDIRQWILKEQKVEEDGTVFRRTGTVSELMVREVVAVTPEDTIEDALLLLHRRRFGALPVVEGRRLVGIITRLDILAAFIDTLNIEGIGVRIEVILPRELKFLHRLVKELEGMGLEIRSLILSPFREEFAAFLRVVTIDVANVKARLRAAGFQVPELADFLG